MEVLLTYSGQYTTVLRMAIDGGKRNCKSCGHPYSDHLPRVQKHIGTGVDWRYPCRVLGCKCSDYIQPSIYDVNRSMQITEKGYEELGMTITLPDGVKLVDLEPDKMLVIGTLRTEDA